MIPHKSLIRSAVVPGTRVDGLGGSPDCDGEFPNKVVALPWDVQDADGTGVVASVLIEAEPGDSEGGPCVGLEPLEMLLRGSLQSESPKYDPLVSNETMVVSKLHYASFFSKTVWAIGQEREDGGKDNFSIRGGGLGPWRLLDALNCFPDIRLKA
jgi:hypothetical protein